MYVLAIFPCPPHFIIRHQTPPTARPTVYSANQHLREESERNRHFSRCKPTEVSTLRVLSVASAAIPGTRQIDSQNPYQRECVTMQNRLQWISSVVVAVLALGLIEVSWFVNIWTYYDPPIIVMVGGIIIIRTARICQWLWGRDEFTRERGL